MVTAIIVAEECGGRRQGIQCLREGGCPCWAAPLLEVPVRNLGKLAAGVGARNTLLVVGHANKHAPWSIATLAGITTARAP